MIIKSMNRKDKELNYRAIEKKSDQSQNKQNEIKHINLIFDKWRLLENNLDYFDDIDLTNISMYDNDHKIRLLFNPKYCLRSIAKDLKTFGSILIFLIIFTIASLQFYNYYTIYEFCKIEYETDCRTGWLATIDKWDPFNYIINECVFNNNLHTSITFALSLINVITIMILLFDKYQALKKGYRVSECLIYVCFYSGGFLLGMPLLCSLNHKIFKLKFMLLASFFTLVSFPSQYFILVFYRKLT